jgi:flagellin FlaB
MDIEGMKVGDGIQYITLTLVPRAGSRDIDLSQTYVEISDSTVKCVLMYLSDEFHNKSEINGSLFTADFFDELNSTRFGVIVLEDADHSISSSAPVINRGDKVMLTIDTVQCFGNVNGIDPRDDIFGIVQSEAGAPGVFSFRAPSSIAGTNIVFDLY